LLPQKLEKKLVKVAKNVKEDMTELRGSAPCLPNPLLLFANSVAPQILRLIADNFPGKATEDSVKLNPNGYEIKAKNEAFVRAQPVERWEIEQTNGPVLCLERNGPSFVNSITQEHSFPKRFCCTSGNQVKMFESRQNRFGPSNQFNTTAEESENSSTAKQKLGGNPSQFEVSTE